MRGAAVIERASATDRAFLAMDGGTLPQQFGVVLLLDRAGPFDLARARSLLEQRVAAVPRLRQRLQAVRFGGGGPIWVDDAGFDISNHVREVVCREPGDEQALWDTAVDLVSTHLPETAPQWAAVFVTGLADGRVALVVVLHHVLTDGVGGLAVLGPIVDQGAALAASAAPPFPRPRPASGQLAREVARRRWHGLRRVGQWARLTRASFSAAGGVRPPRAEPCSLVGPTGRRRRVTVVRVELAPLRQAAHRLGGTTNDAVLVALVAALDRVLQGRGEAVSDLVVTVPVSGRAVHEGADLGNMVSPLLVTVPTSGDVRERIGRVAATVRAQKAAAAGPPPIALLGWVFRPLAALGAYRWYMNHQRRFHTLVSHVRGPDDRLTFDGSTIEAAIPIGVGDGGNVTVFFQVLSYAGTLAVTAIVDPDHFPDLDRLAEAITAELDAILRTRPLPA